MTIIMYIFDAQMSEIKYSTSNKKYILKDDNYQRDKEYLMTLFFTYIKTNKVQINEDGINKFFPNSLNGIVVYGGAKVIHPNSTNEFVFITPYEKVETRYDYYGLEVTSEKFQLIFIRTEYHNK